MIESESSELHKSYGCWF